MPLNPSTAPTAAPLSTPTSPPSSNPTTHNLDILQSMLNFLLIQTGRFLQETALNNKAAAKNSSSTTTSAAAAVGGIGRYAMTMQRAVPIAADRFQDMLDELENEVRMAQMVIRRDLGVLRGEKERKERETREKEELAKRAKLERENAPAAVDQAQVQASMPAARSNDAFNAPPAPSMLPSKPAQPPTDPPSLVTAAASAPPTTTTNTTATVNLVAPPTTSPSAPPALPGTSPTKPQPESRSPLDPPDTDFDFEAIFGDALISPVLDTSTSNALDFDTISNLGGDGAMDLDLTMDDVEGDTQGLLKGLEDFAKEDGDSGGVGQGDATAIDLDFAMGDAMDTAHDPGQASAQQQPTAATTASTNATTASVPPTTTAPAVLTTTVPATTTAPVDSALDDALMAPMATDELEDLFNKPDEYAEGGSLFDDAFFAFGD